MIINKRDKISILILSPELSQSRALAIWLKRNGGQFRVIGGIIAENFRKSKIYPFDGFKKIRRVIDLSEFEIVVPCGSFCTAWLIDKFGDFKIGSVDFNSSNLLVYNKEWLLKKACQIDIPVPDTYINIEEIPENSGPIFYKPRIEGIGGPRRVASSKEKLPRFVKENQFLYQEYISGREVYGFGFIAKKGKILASCQHLEVASMPADGGSAVAIIALSDQRLETLSIKLLEEINYTGWGLVEFKYCPRRKDFVLMEINAKWWASIEYALRCEPLFGWLLFGVEGIRENLPGLIWPDRFLCSIRGNLYPKIFSYFKLPLAWDFRFPKLRSVAAGILPNKLVDGFRNFNRISGS